MIPKKAFINSLDQLQQAKIEFDIGRLNEKSQEINDYLIYYNLDIKGIEYNYGYTRCSGERIFVQSFKPSKQKATVFLIHGYLDHTGTLKNLIQHLTIKQYHVISFDLPGHGLSSGARGSIDGFAMYKSVFKQILQIHCNQLKGPVHLITHSTGSSIAMEYLFDQESIFEKVIFICPLVRCKPWYLSILGYRLFNLFLKDMKRVIRQNSSDPGFMEFVKNDPLQTRSLSLKWVGALIDWNTSLNDRPANNDELLVIQGDKDITVDWKYNLNFIRSQFPNSVIRIIEGGNHQLLNEQETILKKVLSIIENYIE